MVCGVLLNWTISLVYIRDWAQFGGLRTGEKILLIMGSSNILLQLFYTFNFAIYFFFSYNREIPPHVANNSMVEQIIFDYDKKDIFISGIFVSSQTCSWDTEEHADDFIISSPGPPISSKDYEPDVDFIFVLRCFPALGLMPGSPPSSSPASITNFTHGLFVWFRRMISTSLWLLLLLSAVGSFIISVFSIWALNVEIEANPLDNRTSGRSIIKGTFYFSRVYVKIGTVLGSFLPFMLTLLSILLTFSSLIRHVRKIKQNYSGFTQQAHVNAIRRMCLLFVLSAIFCIAQLMFFASRPSSSPDSLVSISWFIVLSFPTADAIIIIQTSSNIQKIFLKTFCAGKHGR
ncbi:taste receptor type 2 member 50-like [Rhinoderma darwinii]|uniref:taste receptor type 2 member 50-like n=1 Tax=Rhinoderma darwinii TaxID=43563 RepID=UPI003F66A3E2